MSVENELVCPAHMRGRGFALLDTHSVPVRHLAVTSGVTFAKGDVAIDDGAGGIKLGVESEMTNLRFMGVACEGGTGVTATNIKIAVWLVSDQDLIWAPVENDTGSLVASDSGEVFDLHSEDGIDRSDTSFGGTLQIGFHCLAVDTTNFYMLGRFIRGAS